MSDLKQKSAGYTMIEVLLVVTIVGVMFTAIMPYFSSMNRTWTVFERQSEQLQNARVALDYFRQEFKQAYRVNAITDDTNTMGDLEFEKPDGSVIRMLANTVTGNTNFSMEDAGVIFPIAGPINELTFVGYDENNNVTDVPALIKSVEMQIEMNNNLVSGNRYTSRVAMKNNNLRALYYAVFGDDSVILNGTGTITGDVHTNNLLDETGGSISVVGQKTDSSTTTEIDFPSVSMNQILSTYRNMPAYEAAADFVISSNFTFVSGNYNGNYYLSNGSTATVEEGAVINGFLVAEGDVLLTGDAIEITPSPNMPAVVASGNVNLSGGFTINMTFNGAVYAGGTINAFISGFNVNGNGRYNIALAAEQDILSACLMPDFDGTVIAGNDAAFNVFSIANFTATDTLPAVMAGRDVLFNTLGNTVNVTGIVYAIDDIFFYNTNTNVVGSILSNDDVELDTNVDIDYDPDLLKNAPIYMW